MDIAAIAAAVITAVVALISARMSARSARDSADAARESAKSAHDTQLEVTHLTAELDRKVREEELSSQAKAVLDRNRGPLVDVARQLGDRIDHIRWRDFLKHLTDGRGREQDAKLTTLFRFAQYFGWREVVRAQVQLLRFDDDEETRRVARVLDDVTWGVRQRPARRPTGDAVVR